MTATQRRLRIAVLNRVFSATGGGAERYSMALVEQLAQRHEIHVFAQAIDHAWPGVSYHLVSAPWSKSRWLNQLWYASATWWLTRRGFDLVHSHENTWHGQVQTVHVLPVRYNLFHGRTGWRLAARWLKVLSSPRLMVYLGLERSRFAAGRVRSIVAISSTLMRQLASAYPAIAHRIEIVTPGVALSEGVSTPSQRIAARQRLGLPAAGRGVLFVGNDYRKKGLHALIGATAQLADDVWIAVVGQGNNSDEFKVLAARLGLARRVHFLGALGRIDDAYVAADCLAHPTLEDTFAMVVLEALAHGLPVVVSAEAYCGISALLTHETNALILNHPRDEVALARALGRIFHEDALCIGLRAAALAFAQRYSWPAIANEQERIYFSVVRQGANHTIIESS